MYTVKENPILPEWLVVNESGDIVCRIHNNDHSYSDDPDAAAQQFAETIVNALNKVQK